MNGDDPSVPMNGLQVNQSFHDFFEFWISDQKRLLEELVSASKNPTLDTASRRRILDRVIRHYEEYYNVKSRFARHNITAMFNPSWLSDLENAFTWIGGWRPSMACQLLYSKSGQQFEARLVEVIRGLKTGDLADLMPEQIEEVNALQMETVKAERRINEKLAKQQEKLADGKMVELTNLVSEAIRNGEAGPVESGRVEGVIGEKKEGLVEILKMADDLRMETLKKMMEILSETQGIYFLIAAAELLIRVHEWGSHLDSAAGDGGDNRRS